MTELGILAASYLGPEGHGNDLTGLRLWPPLLGPAFRRGELAAMHWSLLFGSDPSRFARMDLMCRLGLMAVELLDCGLAALAAEQRERVGVCVETCAGSVATDWRFLRTPRPTSFAYTLPSTVIGEICIRHRLNGPMLCLMSSETAGRHAVAEGAEWLEQGEAGACLCLGCEAVDRDVVEAMPGLYASQPEGWHACALLLAKRQGKPREYPLASAPLLELCRRLCAAGPPVAGC